MGGTEDPAAGIRNPAHYAEKGGVSVNDAVKVALEQAKKKLWEAYETLMDAVDGDAPEFDRVVSFAHDIEDMIDNMVVKGVEE